MADYIYIVDQATMWQKCQVSKRRYNDFLLVRKQGSWGAGYEQYRFPQGMCSDGIFIYICDSINCRIMKRKMDDLTYVTSRVFQSDPETESDPKIVNPYNITCDGVYLYVVDWYSFRIIKLLCSDLSYVSKIGSRGSGNDQFGGFWGKYNVIQGLANDGTYLYICDYGNSRLMKRRLDDLSYVSHYGDNPPSLNYDLPKRNPRVADGVQYVYRSDDLFYGPNKVIYYGNRLYVLDNSNYCISVRNSNDLSLVRNVSYIDIVSGLPQPVSMATDGSFMYMSDYAGYCVHKFEFPSLIYKSTYGNGRGIADNQFDAPWDIVIEKGVTIDPAETAMIIADPVVVLPNTSTLLTLSAVISGKRAILLSWQFGSNADFQVFWKSSSPPGQEYALLTTTNAFSYTTTDLDPSKTYTFYVRANVGATYFYSNVVELFVSCGKGVILEANPPSSPPAQIPFVNVYAAAEIAPGTYDIFKQDAQSGLFNSIGQGGSGVAWRGMCASPNGDIYVAREVGAYPGDIYKQSGGVGDFVALGQGSLRWYVMGAVPNGDIYAGVYSGDIYKQSGGVGNFVALGQTARSWFGMTGDALGNVYACENGGDIYIRTGGTGNFLPLGQTLRTWRGMCASPNGDIYCADYSGDFYVRFNGVGDFVSIGLSSGAARAMAATMNGDIYAAGYGTATTITIRTHGAGNFVPTGDPNRNYVGMAARAY